MSSTETAESAKLIAKARTICVEWAAQTLDQAVLAALKQISLILEESEQDGKKRKRDEENAET